MNTVIYQNKTWRVLDVRSAAQVASEHPVKQIGELMIQNNLELLILQEVSNSTIELGIARIYQPPQQTVAFRDEHQNILDPDSFKLAN